VNRLNLYLLVLIFQKCAIIINSNWSQKLDCLSVRNCVTSKSNMVVWNEMKPFWRFVIVIHSRFARFRTFHLSAKPFISDSIGGGINYKASRERKRSGVGEGRMPQWICMCARICTCKRGKGRRLEGDAYPSCTPSDTEDLADGVRKILFAIRAFS